MAKSYQKPITIYHTVTAAEDTANTAIIDVFSGTLKGGKTTTDYFTFLCQLRTSAGAEVASTSAVYSRTTGLLTVTNASMASGSLIVAVGIPTVDQV